MGQKETPPPSEKQEKQRQLLPETPAMRTGAKHSKAFVGPLVVLILATALAAFPDAMIKYVGYFEGRGSITYSYQKGTEPVTSVTIKLPPDVAGSIDLHETIPGWNIALKGDNLSITDGSLLPGGSLEVKYRVTRYIQSGSKELTITSTTSSGEIITAHGSMVVSETVILKILTFILDHRIPILIGLGMGLFGIIGWIIRRIILGAIQRAGTEELGGGLRAVCPKCGTHVYQDMIGCNCGHVSDDNKRTETDPNDPSKRIYYCWVKGCPGHASEGQQCQLVYRCGSLTCPGHSAPDHRCKEGVWKCGASDCPGHSKPSHRCKR